MYASCPSRHGTPPVRDWRVPVWTRRHTWWGPGGPLGCWVVSVGTPRVVSDPGYNYTLFFLYDWVRGPQCLILTKIPRRKSDSGFGVQRVKVSSDPTTHSQWTQDTSQTSSENRLRSETVTQVGSSCSSVDSPDLRDSSSVGSKPFRRRKLLQSRQWTFSFFRQYPSIHLLCLTQDRMTRNLFLHKIMSSL